MSSEPSPIEPPRLGPYHMGDNDRCGVFRTSNLTADIPTHLGIGARVTDEKLHTLAQRYGFGFEELRVLRDSSRAVQ